MKKSDLIKCIVQMQPNIPSALLSKKEFPKKTLEVLYKRLVNGEEYKDLLDEDLARKKNRRKPKEKKKEVKIIEFSESDVEDEEVEEKAPPAKVEEPVVEEELPKVMPQLVRQHATVPVQEPVVEKKQKFNKIKIKKEIKNMLIPFIKEVKDLILEYKANRDSDYLLDHYNLLLRDQEEIYQEYLQSVDAPDDIYNYTADLLSVHTGKIERLVN
jgi:hypothetical protein